MTAIEPATPVTPLVGVSNEPNGTAVAPGELECSVTVIGPTEFPAPVRVIVIAPACVGESPPENWAEIVSVADPVPDAGDTISHGWFDDAVHVTVPAPLCVMRTVWGGVTAVNAAPLLTAVKMSALRSSVIVAGTTVVEADRWFWSTSIRPMPQYWYV